MRCAYPPYAGFRSALSVRGEASLVDIPVAGAKIGMKERSVDAMPFIIRRAIRHGQTTGSIS
uniref:Uncharacterized protein n=1 Tax=Candidatus Kentrum sp. LPFa TaxID=2126335 RepID=A0A450WMR4_9GAMM|nr:MAG: hypothetical protein BECKLPF1236B_GA0070989_11399 [Candidatus Kentron sp. LPFa]